MEKIFAATLIMVLALNLILTIVVPLSALIINFVCRSGLDGWCYQKIKEDKLGWYTWEDRDDNIIYFDLLLAIVVIMVTAVLLEELPIILTILSYVAILLLTLPVLRWLVDVSRNLRIKKDTGDSKKLQEMQNEIEELKKSVAVSTDNSQKG